MTRMQKTELYLIHPNQCLAFNTFTSLATKICFSLLRRVSRTDSFLKEMLHGYLELYGRIIWIFSTVLILSSSCFEIIPPTAEAHCSTQLYSTQPHIWDHILSSKICYSKAPGHEDLHAFFSRASVLAGDELSASRSGSFNSPGTQWIGSRARATAVQDAAAKKKLSIHAGDPIPVFQSAASHFIGLPRFFILFDKHKQ
jgi:hypothetical protein